MLDQQHGDCPLHLTDQLRQLDRAPRPHPRHRLVEQQKPGVAGQGHADLQLPFLPVGEIGRQEVCTLLQAAPFHRRTRRRREPRIPPRVAPEPETVPGVGLYRERQILLYAELFEDGGDLEGARQPEARPRVGRQATDLPPGEEDAAGIRHDLAAELLYRGGLARAVGADQCVDLPLEHVQGEVAARLQRAEALAQVAHPKQRLSHPAPPR